MGLHPLSNGYCNSIGENRRAVATFHPAITLYTVPLRVASCFLLGSSALVTGVMVSSAIQIQTHANRSVTFPVPGAWGLGAAIPGTTSVFFSVPEVFRRIVKIPC